MDNIIRRILQEYIQQRDSDITEIDFTKHAVDRYFKRFMNHDHLVVKYAKNELSPEKNFYFKIIGTYNISDDIKEDMYELYSKLQDVDYLKEDVYYQIVIHKFNLRTIDVKFNNLHVKNETIKEKESGKLYNMYLKHESGEVDADGNSKNSTGDVAVVLCKGNEAITSMFRYSKHIINRDKLKNNDILLGATPEICSEFGLENVFSYRPKEKRPRIPIDTSKYEPVPKTKKED